MKQNVTAPQQSLDAAIRRLQGEGHRDGEERRARLLYRRFVDEAREGNTREIRCPADQSLVATVDEGTSADTEAAIDAARAAFDSGPWSSTTAGNQAPSLTA